MLVLALCQGLLFSVDGFVTSLLKSPFNQMCYAINKAEGIPDKKKDYIITKATESNEHCKETLKKFGIITIVVELSRVFIQTDKENRALQYENLMVLSYVIPLLFAALAIWLIHKELKKIEKLTNSAHGGKQKGDGLKPDESIFRPGNYDPYRQTQRLDIYRKYIEKLLVEKKAYYCFCSPAELAQEKVEYIKKNQKRNYQYSRKCCQLSEKEVNFLLQKNTPYVLRLKIPQAKKYSFCDLVRGEINFQGQDIEDFVLWRQNGMPNYNLACVVDDYLMKISHVLRGEEHLSNTGKQLVLYEALK
ncbi:7582_t:CDS:2 [Ambispora gerdemannii]|uniref:7582_t:CDS:1 n=1 Tax=Ambispora gerdemannii TaxID=144530 RepID=A0A9N8ZU57_9GLOM|nr:7582_t:CDS:2 [Ambispora gerdemannii]